MKINTDPRIQQTDPYLTALLREIAIQINGVSEGKLSASYTASTSYPTTGTWAKGDYVKNSSPVESGTAGSKYVIEGWVCVTGGTPGTWVQKRFLTGN